MKQKHARYLYKEQMVLNYVNTHGKITRQEAIDLCRISEDQATYLLRKLSLSNHLKLSGRGRSAHYIKP
jgi:ATP-dependent DNA helicase RecG